MNTLPVLALRSALRLVAVAALVLVPAALAVAAPAKPPVPIPPPPVAGAAALDAPDANTFRGMFANRRAQMRDRHLDINSSGTPFVPQDLDIRLMGAMLGVDDTAGLPGGPDDQNNVSQGLAFAGARHVIPLGGVKMVATWRAEFSRVEGQAAGSTEFANAEVSQEQISQFDLRKVETFTATQVTTIGLNRAHFDFDFSGTGLPLAISYGKQAVEWGASGMKYGVVDPFAYAGLELVSQQDVFRPDTYGHDLLRMSLDFGGPDTAKTASTVANTVADAPEIERPRLPDEGRVSVAQRFSRVPGAKIAAIKYEVPGTEFTDWMFTLASRERGMTTPGFVMFGAGVRAYMDRVMVWLEGLIGEQRAPATKLGAWAVGAGIQLSPQFAFKLEMQWKSTSALLSAGPGKSYVVANLVYKHDENLLLQGTVIFNQVDESSLGTFEATWVYSDLLKFMVGFQQNYGNPGDEFGPSIASDNFAYFRAIYTLPLGLHSGEKALKTT